MAFIENGFNVVALDGSIELARIASQRANIDVVVKDFSELEFQSEFDGIWAAASLTHVSPFTLTRPCPGYINLSPITVSGNPVFVNLSQVDIIPAID